MVDQHHDGRKLYSTAAVLKLFQDEGFSNVSEKLMLDDMEINGEETVMSNEQINSHYACDNSRCGR